MCGLQYPSIQVPYKRISNTASTPCILIDSTNMHISIDSTNMHISIDSINDAHPSPFSRFGSYSNSFLQSHRHSFLNTLHIKTHPYTSTSSLHSTTSFPSSTLLVQSKLLVHCNSHHYPSHGFYSNNVFCTSRLLILQKHCLYYRDRIHFLCPPVFPASLL